jgi:hypothetical protein
MNQAAATVLSGASMDEPELLQVSTDGGPRLLLDWVAEKLAVRLNDTPQLRGWLNAEHKSG